jgi:hypothetical protein
LADIGLIQWLKLLCQLANPEVRPMTLTNEKSLTHLKRHLADYHAYLDKALAALTILETTDSRSEAFSDALAELHVCATVLEPYSEGMVEAINQYTEALPDD